MNDVAIRVESLGKQYRIGQREPYKALRDVISNAATGAVRRLAAIGRRTDEAALAASERQGTFWALKDVSFEIERGEVVGIIGRNGAGKSTLLKILSRITKPTEGRAEIHGRVGSLLEVGTGFHPELTGRENVYLNGAILGMRRAEIDRKFDEIVAFAEVERFLDTPVKRYSSGMFVRLAFAVAAHLELEVLLIDEVLAVGDMLFQKKCLGKMGDMARQGRTVLFVSHNMAAVEHLCTRALLISQGQVTRRGPTGEVVAAYLSDAAPIAPANGVLATGIGGTLKLLLVDIAEDNAISSGIVRCGDDVTISLTVDTDKDLSGLTCLVALKDRFGSRLSALNSAIAGYYFDLASGRHAIRCRIPHFPLSPETYEVEVKILSRTGIILWAPRALDLRVEAGDFYGSGRFPDPAWAGVFHLQHVWDVRPA